MAYGVRLHVWGERALFTRAEMKVERVSYDVITPSACRGILEAIHWKPAIRWKIDRIRVLKPIRFESFRRNEVKSKASAANARRAMNSGSIQGLHLLVDKDRTQRAATLLKDVAYVIEARFELTERSGADDNEGKHLDIFNRRARKGQTFHQPYLGTREFPCAFSLLEEGTPEPEPEDGAPTYRDLGWMLYDFDYETDDDGRMQEADPRFFRARIDGDGWLDLRGLATDEVKQ